MKTLVHDQIIRVAGFPSLNEVTVSTLEGYVADHNARYGGHADMSVEDHLKLDRKFNRETAWAWASQRPGILTGNYPGKWEKLDAEQAAIAAALIVTDGEIVEITAGSVAISGEIKSRRFTVQVMGNYSDPVHFTLIDPK